MLVERRSAAASPAAPARASSISFSSDDLLPLARRGARRSRRPSTLNVRASTPSSSRRFVGHATLEVTARDPLACDGQRADRPRETDALQRREHDADARARRARSRASAAATPCSFASISASDFASSASRPAVDTPIRSAPTVVIAELDRRAVDPVGARADVVARTTSPFLARREQLLESSRAPGAPSGSPRRPGRLASVTTSHCSRSSPLAWSSRDRRIEHRLDVGIRGLFATAAPTPSRPPGRRARTRA